MLVMSIFLLLLLMYWFTLIDNLLEIFSGSYSLSESLEISVFVLFCVLITACRGDLEVWVGFWLLTVETKSKQKKS